MNPPLWMFRALFTMYPRRFRREYQEHVMALLCDLYAEHSHSGRCARAWMSAGLAVRLGVMLIAEFARQQVLEPVAWKGVAATAAVAAVLTAALHYAIWLYVASAMWVPLAPLRDHVSEAGIYVISGLIPLFLMTGIVISLSNFRRLTRRTITN